MNCRLLLCRFHLLYRFALQRRLLSTVNWVNPGKIIFIDEYIYFLIMFIIIYDEENILMYEMLFMCVKSCRTCIIVVHYFVLSIVYVSNVFIMENHFGVFN